MKNIKVLGPGCPKCNQLAANVKEAADQLGLDYELEKVTEIKEIMSHGIMLTPGLVVDGQVKSSGKLLDVDTIKGMLGAD